MGGHEVPHRVARVLPGFGGGRSANARDCLTPVAVTRGSRPLRTASGDGIDRDHVIAVVA